jgi:hypothetical protein
VAEDLALEGQAELSNAECDVAWQAANDQTSPYPLYPISSSSLFAKVSTFYPINLSPPPPPPPLANGVDFIIL